MSMGTWHSDWLVMFDCKGMTERWSEVAFVGVCAIVNVKGRGLTCSMQMKSYYLSLNEWMCYRYVAGHCSCYRRCGYG